MKRKMWSCMETQKHVIPFIDDQLSISDLDAFLYHMEHCPDCKEEYDVYYTMLMGMRFLESDNMSALKMDSEEKLLSAEDYLYKYKIKFIAKILCFVLLCVGMILQL